MHIYDLVARYFGKICEIYSTDSGFSCSGFYRFRLFVFRVLQIPAFCVPGFTDSGFSCSGFYRFGFFVFRVLQIPAFRVPGFTDSGFSCSGFYRFRIFVFRVLQIPAFHVPGFLVPCSVPRSVPRFPVPCFTDSLAETVFMQPACLRRTTPFPLSGFRITNRLRRVFKILICLLS